MGQLLREPGTPKGSDDEPRGGLPKLISPYGSTSTLPLDKPIANDSIGPVRMEGEVSSKEADSRDHEYGRSGDMSIREE